MLAIDFGARSIKVVKLSRTGSGYHLDNFGMVLTPPDSILHGEIKDIEAVSQALNKMLHKKRLYDRGSIIAITGQKVIIREITTPLMTEKELSEGLQWEAPKYVPYDLKESLLDAKKIEELEEKEGTKMMKVLLVAAPKTLVEQQISVLKNIKMQPKIVDIVANAQIRAFESYLTPSSSSTEDGTMIDIILSMGASTTEITLLEGDRLKFTRTILKGGSDITRLIEKKFNLPFQEAEALKRHVGLSLPEEALIAEDNNDIKVEEKAETDAILEQMDEEQINTKIDKKDESMPAEEEIADLIHTGVTDVFNEIRKSLNYFKTQYQKVKYQRIILCGGMTQLLNIGQTLKKQFGITVVIANPLKSISVNEQEVDINHLDKYKSALATAIGLAKRER
ncbi:MAG: type IV pilus assembly protein PilM [Atribacterota bacterium]|jgi:type IV pilus assembly protein PilM|nr:type IV pilus assembly protein PilM [Atribacterota bacterium]MDD4897033.1 type IV pilus assembly protein PilM [Atribacterota bacterium]MDD5636214.1 type IV pilus assembly protein PilM [Atribacterota bacterium]